MPRCILFLALCLGCTSWAHAWSNKEHIQLTRLAAEGLLADNATPTALKTWLSGALVDARDADGERQYFLTQRVGLIPRGVQGLTYWAIVPDMDALTARDDQPVAPFGVAERMLHFIDLENFFPDATKRFYADDLFHKPALADIPRDMTDPRWKAAGMLPFRVQDCYQRVVADLRAGLLDDVSGRFPRDEHAVHWAGFLAHYAEDNTQPQHNTADYKSRSYFADKKNAPNVHWDVEGRLLDDEFDDYTKLRTEFWPIFTKDVAELKDPTASDDPWVATVQVSLQSYDALPLIGRAAAVAYQKGAFDADAFFHYQGTYLGRPMTLLEMKAYQMAWAVKRVQRLWLAAWAEAHK